MISFAHVQQLWVNNYAVRNNYIQMLEGGGVTLHKYTPFISI